MEIMDFEELHEVSDGLERILCKLEELVNPDAGLDDELVQIVLAVSDAWTKLDFYVSSMGRNPQDIIKGGM